LSLLTAAFAEARLASRVAALIVVFEVELEELEGFASVEVVVVPSRVVFFVVLGRVAGVVVVVVLGDVVVGALVGVVVVAGVVVVVVVVGGVKAAATTWAPEASWLTEAAEAVPALAPVLDPEPLVELSPSVSSSLARLASADCRAALPCSRVTSALWGSSLASSCPARTC
jgi:hypothetical protein